MGILQSNRTNMNTVASAIGMAASFIPYTKNLTNVSATGLKVLVCPTENGSPTSEPITISKFSDDRAPLQIEDATYREIETTFGYKMMYWNVVPKVKISVSVIPCTQDDFLLGNLAYANSEVELEVSQVRQSSKASAISVAGIGKGEVKDYGIKFTGGLILSSPPSGSYGQPQGNAEANGRWSAHTYTFVFAKWNMLERSASQPSYIGSLLKTVGIG